MKILQLVPFVALLLTSTVAMADSDDRRAGTTGHVTAYESDGKTVIDVDSCPTRRGAFDYTACGEPFRAKIRAAVCRDKGKGRHAWRYQIGTSKLISQSVSCR